MKRQTVFLFILFFFFSSILMIRFPGIRIEAYGVPEKIKPGISYYSDDYTELHHILELGEEKNLEEVYQHYQYYEAIYNNRKQILWFKAYKRGEVEWQERYFYDPEGNLERKEREFTGHSKKTIKFK